MNKRGSKWIWISLVLTLILIALFVFYILIFNPGNDYLYNDKIESGSLKNPVSDLSLEEAVGSFDESYIYYLLYELEAYNLHNPPLSSEKPKIEIKVGEDYFNSIIENGVIRIYVGQIDDEDIRIITTREEIVSMLKDKDYLKESFSSGRSSFELIADNKILFYKGYLSIYNKVSEKSMTGNVIKIYSS